MCASARNVNIPTPPTRWKWGNPPRLSNMLLLVKLYGLSRCLFTRSSLKLHSTSPTILLSHGPQATTLISLSITWNTLHNTISAPPRAIHHGQWNVSLAGHHAELVATSQSRNSRLYQGLVGTKTAKKHPTHVTSQLLLWFWSIYSPKN